MGQSIQEWTKYNLRKTAFKKFEVIWSASANAPNKSMNDPNVKLFFSKPMFV